MGHGTPSGGAVKLIKYQASYAQVLIALKFIF